MTMTQSRRGSQSGAQGPPHAGRKRPAWRWLGGLVPLCWLVPVVTHLCGIDWLLPALVLVGTASLLRVGRSLLDRLMFALMLLLGATCVAGLLFSVWPWGLGVIAVAGLALTVLAGIGVLMRRRPQLPAPSLVDLAVLLAAMAVAYDIARPYLRVGLTGRLQLAVNGEDLIRHVTVFDAIQQLGGYLFLHPATAARYVYSGMIYYPQGTHIIYALVDGFLPHRDHTAVTAFSHFIGAHVAGYGLLVLSMIWATLWIGGRLLTSGWRWLPVVVLLSLFAARGELLLSFIRGYPSEVMGMALMVSLIAVLARPVGRTRTQLVILGSLVIGIGFSYYLYLPGAVLACAGWLLLRRRRLSYRLAGIAATGVVVVLAATPAVLGLWRGGQTSALTTMAYFRESRDVLLALVLVTAAGTLSPAGRRSRVWRSYGVALLGVFASAVVLAAVQRAETGATGYYLEKTLEALQVSLLVGIGAVTMLLPPPRIPRIHQRHSNRQAAGILPLRLPLRVRNRLAQALPAVLIAGAIGGAVGAVRSDSPYRPRAARSSLTWGQLWVGGRISNKQLGSLTATLVEHYPPPPGGVTVLMSDDPYANYAVSLFAAALQRNAGASISHVFYVGQMPGTTPYWIRRMVYSIDGPVRVVVTSCQILTALDDIKAEDPGKRLSIADLCVPGTSGF